MLLTECLQIVNKLDVLVNWLVTEILCRLVDRYVVANSSLLPCRPWLGLDDLPVRFPLGLRLVLGVCKGLLVSICEGILCISLFNVFVGMLYEQLGATRGSLDLRVVLFHVPLHSLCVLGSDTRVRTPFELAVPTDRLGHFFLRVI